MRKSILTQQAQVNSCTKRGNQLRNLVNQVQVIHKKNADEPIFKDLQEEAIFPINNVPTSQSQGTYRQSNPLSISGRHIYPSPGHPTGKPIPYSKPINSENPSTVTNTSTLNQSKEAIPNQGLGPKFKPLQETEILQLKKNIDNSMPLPRPTSAELNILQNTDSPVITLVGKGVQKKVNSGNQQKKILKFQMKMVSMQQDKLRQVKAIQQTSQGNEPGVVNAFVNPSVGLLKPEETDVIENSVTMENPIGVQMPKQMHSLDGSQHSTDVRIFLDPPELQNPNISLTPPGVPNAVGIQGVVDMHGQPHNTNHTNIPPSNVYNKPIQTAPPRPRPQKIKKNKVVKSVSKPLSLLEKEAVETVFQMENDQPRSLTPPINSKPMTSSNQRSSKPVNIQSGRPKNYPVDKYGFNYPKGIPRSFLIQPQQTITSQTVLGKSKGPIWPSYRLNPPVAVPPPTVDTNTSNHLMTETDEPEDFPQPYSPSELYADFEKSHGADFEEGDSHSQEPSPSGQKRLSIFQRLGPQTQPKKPKLTISVTVNDHEEVREVVDETEEVEEITPVHLREDIILSTDETVMKYLKAWPWKRNVVVKKSVTARNSKTVMMLEREQMEEIYNKDTIFVQVTVRGYPSSWKKEQVLDTLLENIRGYSFVPCFIEFNLQECKFLTLRCRSALLSLHKCGFTIRKNEVELTVTIAQTELTLSQLDFVPRLVLRKRLNMCGDKESKLNLSAFTLKEDISHFIYFPLNRLINQMEIIEMQNDISWNFLTDLNLSHNRIESIDGFDLEQSAPKLKHLDLSYNYLEKITLLLKIRRLPLTTIHLEGNPLCRNYIDPDQYVKAVKIMFSSVNTIDGVAVPIKGEIPKFYRNYCPEDARALVEKFLEVYFPLLDGDNEHRQLLEDMYETTANMTVTYSYKMALSPIYRCFKSLFANARHLDQGKMDILKGSKAITNNIANWPYMEHDPLTFTVDVIYHSDSTTILRVDGILKLTRESLAEDEYLLAFSRTAVLHTRDGMEYKIQAETLYWSVPTGNYARSAFSITTIKTKQLYPKIDSTTDEKLQQELLNIFMKLTTMNKNVSERCLELKKWNLSEALDHFTKLWKLDALESLTKEVS